MDSRGFDMFSFLCFLGALLSTAMAGLHFGAITASPNDFDRRNGHVSFQNAMVKLKGSDLVFPYGRPSFIAIIRFGRVYKRFLTPVERIAIMAGDTCLFSWNGKIDASLIDADLPELKERLDSFLQITVERKSIIRAVPNPEVIRKCVSWILLVLLVYVYYKVFEAYWNCPSIPPPIMVEPPKFRIKTSQLMTCDCAYHALVEEPSVLGIGVKAKIPLDSDNLDLFWDTVIRFLEEMRSYGHSATYPDAILMRSNN